MSTVYIQIAPEFQSPILAHLRQRWAIGLEISDSGLWDQLLDDVGRTLTDYCACWQRRGQQKPTPDCWIFLHSRRQTSAEQVGKLAYEVLLQDYGPKFPLDDNDVPVDVAGTPKWLNRVIVVVWQIVAKQSKAD